VLAVFDDVPSSEVDAARVEGEGVAVADLLVSCGLAASKSEAARLIRSGGVYVNNRRVPGERDRLVRTQAIAGQLFLLRKGQRQNHLVRVRD
jgi:tyrosyl-tRNA synthetase